MLNKFPLSCFEYIEFVETNRLCNSKTESRNPRKKESIADNCLNYHCNIPLHSPFDNILNSDYSISKIPNHKKCN